jgi:DnaJ-class molecular chaperone
MDWRRLLRRGPEPNPETQERVRCELCDGTGIEHVDGKMLMLGAKPVRCPNCRGAGWLTMEKAPD